MTGAGLRLEVKEFADLTRWRWVLTDAGEFLADHEVRLDAGCWQYEAFTDLLGYLSWHVAPDQRAQDEDRIVSKLGGWIGSEVLGPVAGKLVAQRPATVRVIVPDEARTLAFRPLELAHVNNKPLAVQDVTLVIEPSASPAESPADRSAPIGERLRVLGLFSLPDGGQPLNLRRERQALVKLIQGIDATGKAADVRVLQYGVTRERLQDALEEAEGWDVIHVSGHGAPGELLLETADGRPDQVTAADLADLLDLARTRVKLVTISACWSAALTASEQRRLLGLPIPTHPTETERTRSSPSTQANSAPLATELTGRLGCAVLAMRYPVDDDFAIALSRKLYELLAEKAQPLPRAVGVTLKQLARDYPALSVATPALFGGQAVDLTLAAPKRAGTRSYGTDSGNLKMAGFPDQPERFVGRTGVMARASAVLAAESGIPGVMLHGMPGGGKTACALELAYGHEHSFEHLIWYKAPDDGMDITGALTDFALTLERYLDGFQMAHLLTSPDSLAGFLPWLTELMERFRLLIVIDNAESLLTESGQWRDDRWGHVLAALTAHAGLGRMIMTSRRVPARLTGPRVEAVDALSADEVLLLARELPHLRALIYDELPGLNREVSRRLALGVLNIAQGHPKLLELANGQAAHPYRLAALVEKGDQAWRERGGLPEGFFATSEPDSSADGITATAADYWHVLDAWTGSVADTLAPGERDLFWFLCCLEEPDRERFVLDANWADLWQRLGRDGEPPNLDQALAAIAAHGLASIREAPGNASASGPAHPDAAGTGPAGAQPAPDDGPESYPVHPGVAETGRDHAGQPFRDAVDAEAAAFWDAVHRQASGQAGDGSVDTGLLVRAGLAAVPYLLRQQHWGQAATLLEDAFLREPSWTNAAAVLPAIEQITRHQPRWAITLARVLAVTDPAAADATLRTAMAEAATRGDYRDAAVAAGRLIDLCRDGGRLAEALDLAGQMAGYTRQAGLGPWTQLSDEARRLQVLTAMGHNRQVLDEVTRLRAHMATLPATPGPNETVPPWDVREVLLGTGRSAALLLGQYADALALNAEVVASMRDRRAPATSIARARFNDYGPLLRLGRTGEALQVLLDCRQVFQDAHDTRSLGKTLSALADTENLRGHGDAALRLERDALRYKYLAVDVDGIAVSYHNLGNYLRHHARQPAPALASHLTAALICTLTGLDGTDGSVRAAATEVRESGTAVPQPSNVADLCCQVGDIPGTDLPGLLAVLSPDPDTAEQAFRDLIAQVQELAAAPSAEGSPDG